MIKVVPILEALIELKLSNNFSSIYQSYLGELPQYNCYYKIKDKQREVTGLYGGQELIDVNVGHREWLDSIQLHKYLMVGDDEINRKFLYNIENEKVYGIFVDTYEIGTIENLLIFNKINGLFDVCGMNYPYIEK